MDRTNVELDTAKINKISELTGKKTKKEIIDFSLTETLENLERLKRRRRMLEMQGCGWGWDEEEGELRQ